MRLRDKIKYVCMYEVFRDEVFAGFLSKFCGNWELFEIIQNENTRERHRVQVHRLPYTADSLFFHL